MKIAPQIFCALLQGNFNSINLVPQISPGGRCAPEDHIFTKRSWILSGIHGHLRRLRWPTWFGLMAAKQCLDFQFKQGWVHRGWRGLSHILASIRRGKQRFHFEPIIPVIVNFNVLWDTQIFDQLLFWVFLWVCFWMSLTFKMVDWV